MGLPCLTPPLYYCADADKIVAYAQQHGETSAAKLWLQQMDFEIDRAKDIVVREADGSVVSVRVAGERGAAPVCTGDPCARG